ncbi:MAG TPA: ABC transporter permease [Solirubrobacterales bacterium]|nr:ABC transporter permease [Solirubrobacterales bacterium]
MPFAQPWGRRGMGTAVKVALTILALLVLTAIFAPVLTSVTGSPAPGASDTSSLSRSFGTPAGPSAAHWFGVDGLGRDVFSRTLYGARVSLLVAFCAAALSLLVGVTLGMIAGFRRGLTDSLISRLIETFLVIPYLLLAIGITASCSTGGGCLNGTLTPGIPLVILVIAMTSWPVVARIVRNQTLAIRESDYVTAARLAGLSPARILATEVLPNLASSIFVFAIVLLPQAILAEAALTFLGVGVPASTPSWGGMIARDATLFPDTWWIMVFPGAALLITVFACTVVADYVRDLTFGGRVAT